MKKEYETYVDSLDQLQSGKELALEVRSLEPGKHKYEIKRVRGILAKEGESLTGTDVLKIRFSLGEPAPAVMAIKILKELP